MTRMPEAVEMDVVAGPGAEGARRATGGPGGVTTSGAPDPDPEVPAMVQRRRFPAAYRLRILKQADACTKPGEVGALLRREGLYSSLLANWRRQREAGALREMRGRRRGPTPRPVDRASSSSRRRIAGSSGSCSGRRRSSPSKKKGSPTSKQSSSDQELCDLGRNRLIVLRLPEQYFLASVDGRLRRPRSGWGACSAAAKSRRKVFNLWLLLDDRWAGDTAQVEPVR